MLVMLETSNSVRSIVVSLLHPENISLMSVTLEGKCSGDSIVVRNSMFLNQPWVLVMGAFSNPG